MPRKVATLFTMATQLMFSFNSSSTKIAKKLTKTLLAIWERVKRNKRTKTGFIEKLIWKENLEVEMVVVTLDEELESIEETSLSLKASRKARKAVPEAIRNISRNTSLESMNRDAIILPTRKPVLAIMPSLPNFSARSSAL